MNEDQKIRDMSLSEFSDSDNKIVITKKNNNLKNWSISVMLLVIFMISGYFVWLNFQKKELDSAVVSSVENIKKEEYIKTNTTKSLLENRDMKRKIDLVNLLLALQSYKIDKNIYPSTNNIIEKNGDKNSAIYSLKSDYIKNIPIDSQSPKFYYSYSSNGKTFTLTARLENEKDPNCTMVDRLCLYKLSETNNKEELLKIVRENLDFINSIRIVSTSDWTRKKPGEEAYRMIDDRDITRELLLDLVEKKIHSHAYETKKVDKKIDEIIVVDGRFYSKNGIMAMGGGSNYWMELKEGDELPGIPDSPGQDNIFHMPDLSNYSSVFDFIKSVSDVKKITIENIDGKEYYHLKLQPKNKERNKFLDEYIGHEVSVYGTEISIDELFDDKLDEEYIFQQEQVFKFTENNKQIIIPFSELINRPIFRVLFVGSQYDENEYSVNVYSISGDIWIDRETFLPFRENTGEYDVRYDYNLKTKEKGFWEEASEITINKQYFDINKELDIKVPELAKIEDTLENQRFITICDKIKGGYTKNQCVEVANTKKIFYYGMETPIIKTVDDCEDIPHAENNKNTQRDRCFLGLMKKLKDVSICEKIEDSWETRTDCYIQAAKTTGNKDFCQKINYDYIEDWCKGTASNILFCQSWDLDKSIFQRKGINDFENYCIAVAERDERQCVGFTTYGVSKSECYTDIATEKKDSSFCDRIDSGSAEGENWKLIGVGKNQCYLRMAITTNDVALCEKIEMGKSEDQKYDCMTNVAISNSDESICDKLPGDNIKDSCYLGIVYNLITEG